MWYIEYEYISWWWYIFLYRDSKMWSKYNWNTKHWLRIAKITQVFYSCAWNKVHSTCFDFNSEQQALHYNSMLQVNELSYFMAKTCIAWLSHYLHHYSATQYATQVHFSSINSTITLANVHVHAHNIIHFNSFYVFRVYCISYQSLRSVKTSV